MVKPISPHGREPPNKPNTRKDDLTVGGFFSVCSVYSVVQKNGIATNLAVGIGTTGRGTFAPPEIQPEIQSVGKHQKHPP